MEISKIWTTQRKLRNAGQIPAMIEELRDGGLLPPIPLSRAEDGSIQAEDGHHRLCAIWLSGRKRLEDHEYFVVENDRVRPRFGRVSDLVERMRCKV